MYKVFVNEKKLLISKHAEELEKKLVYENYTTLEMALDLLENTSVQELNILEKISMKYGVNFKSFSGLLKLQEASSITLREKRFSSKD